MFEAEYILKLMSQIITFHLLYIHSQVTVSYVGKKVENVMQERTPFMSREYRRSLLLEGIRDKWKGLRQVPREVPL